MLILTNVLICAVHFFAVTLTCILMFSMCDFLVAANSLKSHIVIPLVQNVCGWGLEVYQLLTVIAIT